MAVAAECSYRQPEQPLVIVIPECAEDQLVRARAARFIGSVMTRREAALDLPPSQEVPERFSTLQAAIKGAANGDPTASKQVSASVRTDIIERTFKAGIVLEPVRQEIDTENNIWQHGQYADEVQANALLYASDIPQMRSRTEAETRNNFRLKYAYENGLLKDYYFVVCSLVPEDMTKEQLEEAGFFDTMSCSMQVTAAEDGGLSTESAFVAGVKKLGDDRYDIQTINQMAASLGVNYQAKTTTQILDTPLLIHKSRMPNGVIDLVKLYDEVAGDDIFFGEAKTKQDYLAYVAVCRQQSQLLEHRVREIMRDLLLDADKLQTPLDAVERLHELSQYYMVEQAVEDKTINPRVFGPAAVYIEQARLHLERGNQELAQAATTRAQAVARSSSCPGSRYGKAGEQYLTDSDRQEDSSMEGDEEVNIPSTIKCIKCKYKSPKKEVISAKSWRCPHCSYEVDICTGVVLSLSKPPRKAEQSAVAKQEERRHKATVRLWALRPPEILEEPEIPERAA